MAGAVGLGVDVSLGGPGGISPAESGVDPAPPSKGAEVYGNSYSNNDAAGVASMMGTFGACYFIVVILLYAFMFYVCWRILTKAGYSGWLTLLNLIPFGTLGIMLMLAFGNWPVLRGGTGGSSPRGGYPPPQPGYTPPVSGYQPPSSGYQATSAYGPPEPPNYAAPVQNYAPPAYEPPAPPAQPTYQPPTPPAVMQPPAPTFQPAYEPPPEIIDVRETPPPPPVFEQPPAPPTPPAGPEV